MLQLHFTCRELALLSTVFVRRNESSSRLSRKIGWSTTAQSAPRETANNNGQKTNIEISLPRGEPAELDFPLRQRHIADATGLTPVHVSKVLSEFRRSGLIRLSERSLTILDLTGFRRIANMR
ncbi:MAG: helix-turn-helix domain-containing protein [Pseudolabrys sp.]